MFDTGIKASLSAAGNWYRQFERPISSLSLIGGFVFDALTLKRLDMFWENFWVVVHLIVVAACIILINRMHERIDSTDGGDTGSAERHFWWLNILQFFFGGILSTFLVFYFRSATLAVSWPFLLILLAAFFANESFRKQYEQLSFQICLFYLSLFLFAIYMVPVLIHRIGSLIFLLSGFTSLGLLVGFVVVLKYFAREEITSTKGILFVAISGMYLVMNVLYFFNFIPPIPLSLRDAGIYQSIAKQPDGNYLVQGEDQGPLRFLKFHENIHVPPGAPLFAYSAVFSPTALSTDIVHEWQWYNARSGRWVRESRVDLPVAGGRDGGYRTYSMIKGVMPGLWRVNVETPTGQVLGRLRFYVVAVEEESALQTEIKN
jgi:hypothetical protein